MFKKIKNRLIILIVFILFSFIASIAYLKVKEGELVKSIAEENRLELQSSIINYLSQLQISVIKSSQSQPGAEYSISNIPFELLNNSFFSKIAVETDSKIKIISKIDLSNHIQNNISKPYISYFIVKLLNEKTATETEKYLFVQKESDALKQKFYSAKYDNLLLTSFFLILSLIIIAALHLQIIRPITAIISSFVLNKPDQLIKLQNIKSEFGVFANLINQFFDQKKILEEEVKVRKITQEELETLNDELEKRVSDRTQELAITNLELQKERDQTKKYLDIAGTIIAILDRDGYVKLINKKGDEVLGYQQGELIGKNWYETCIHENNRDEYKQMHNDIILEKIEPVEFIIGDVITKGKETRTLIFHKTFLKDSEDKFSAVLFSAEDITELKLKEKELIEAKEKADESNRLKSTFLANMSHELRTPMIGILGYSDLLMNEIKNINHSKMATAIHDSGQRLIDTLNMILDLSRLEANKQNIDYQVVNLNTLVKNVTFHFEAAAGKKKLFIKTIVPSYDVVSKTDPRLIRDVMNNLINNAIKFTNDGGVFITLEAFHRDFIISIKDTGIGIPEESIDVIFEEFRQVSEGLGRGFQGTGLGLTICKKYVELLGGQISVKSTPNKGSEFSFQIPLFSGEVISETDSAEKNEIESNENNFQEQSDNLSVRLKILVVEDDATSRDVISIFLKKLYDVAFAFTGEEALDKVEKENFDLIIMDINLGSGITGIEVKDKIRSFVGYENTPIIAATAFAMLGDREKFLASGFDHYISKPYLKQQLLKLLEDTL